MGILLPLIATKQLFQKKKTVEKKVVDPNDKLQAIQEAKMLSHRDKIRLLKIVRRRMKNDKAKEEKQEAKNK